MKSKPEVIVDGVHYVPVSAAHIALPAIEDAIISQWAGDNWREDYPEALHYLRICVSDDEDASGSTVSEFAARLLAAANSAQAPTHTS